MNTLNSTIDEECSWRFVTGTVINIQAGVLHLAVDVPQNQEIKQARLEFDGKEAKHYELKQVISLFLLSPVKEKPLMWHAADGLMAEPEHNPWRQQAFSDGDSLEGVVKDYVGDDAAIITLTGNLTRELDWRCFKGLTGYLHRLQTPDGAIVPNIRRILHVGDTVQVLLAGSDRHPAIDNKLLHLRLNVNQLLLQRERQADTIEPTFPVFALQEFTAENDLSPKRPELRVLLVDDDVEFCKSLQRSLATWNVKLRYCHKLVDVQKELADYCFDACLLDCDLGSENSRYNAIELALQDTSQQTAMKLLWITGNHDLVEKHVNLTMEKPIKLTHLLSWLDTGNLPTVQGHRVMYQGKAARWRATGNETQVIQRAQQLLKRCCASNPRTSGALWIRAARDGFYTVLAAHGIKEADYRDLERRFQNTCISTAINTQTPQEVGIKKSGSLHDFMVREQYGSLWVYPKKMSNQEIHALAVFSGDILGELVQNDIKSYAEHFNDLMLWLADAQQLEASEVFATQGRMLSSTLHEIRTASSVVAGNNDHLQQLFRFYPQLKCPDTEVQENLQAMALATARLLELCENGLDHIRANLTKIPNVAILVAETLKLMRGRMRAENYSAQFTPLSNQLPQVFSLPFPPKYVEIPLINLLDNAFQHCGQRHWARVHVSISFDLSNAELPLVIRVEDNGLGMTQEQVKKLFAARNTTRSVAGTGMGLYLAKQLVDSIGGIIALEKSVRWFGSCFIIRLPLDN
ncbi:MAG: hybrid sensor histidine kinase/response regulator [Methylococcales bacterium]|nr:hybrid sensor histidine kinase/response regulator [Methylococcales bacterium]